MKQKRSLLAFYLAWFQRTPMWMIAAMRRHNTTFKTKRRGARQCIERDLGTWNITRFKGAMPYNSNCHRFMKTKLLILTFALFGAFTAQANFINLTPGGWHYIDHQNNPSPALLQLLDEEGHDFISYFDTATPSGWVSQFGVLNGGTNFFTDLINSGPLSSSVVSWDFLGTPYAMRFVDVFGFNSGDPWEAVYLVTGFTQFNSNGDLPITINGHVIITDINFYGSTPNNVVPESGSTIAFMGLGLLVVSFVRRRVQ